MERVVWLAALLVSAALAQDSGLFELNVVHYNDFHAHFDEVSPQGTVCSAQSEPCIGGYARLYTAVQQVLEAEPDSLLLNGGDTFQGTIWYNFLRWNVSQHFMNMLPHDAHVLGNHEFDHGVEGLVPYLERLEAPMLGANVNTTLEPSMTPYIKNHVVVERHGRKIGIIGVLLRQFSAPTGRVIMEDELEAVNREAAILTEMGIDIIIVLSHIGYTSDIDIARRVSPTVDIIVGGHSHTLLYNGETPNGDTALGEYPTVVTQDNGHKIPIVQASCYTRYLGNIKFYINDQGVVERWVGEPVFLGSSIVQVSRNAMPSLNQLEKLVSFLEEKPWLAMGHARTANARIRSRQAWSEITTALNSDGSGCTKTSEQWCKYWKDKKGAVKRKSSIIAAARRRTGGGIEDLPELNELELKIQSIMGGESFGSGDQILEINPFQEEPINRAVDSEESPSILCNIAPPNEQPADLSEVLVSESGHEMQWSNFVAVDGDSVRDNLAQVPSCSRDAIEPAPDAQSPEAVQNRVLFTEPIRPASQQTDVLETGNETPTQRVHRETLRSRRRTVQFSPRQSAARRRLLRRSPPSQRRSEMVSLTERFLAIEERRANAELLIAQAISRQVDGQQAMAQALDRVGSAIIDFINK